MKLSLFTAAFYFLSKKKYCITGKLKTFYSKWFEPRSISSSYRVRKGTSETISRILQPYNIRVAHKPTTTLRHLLTNVKDRDEPSNRQGAVYKIKCSDCQAPYIGETGKNLNTRLTEHKRAPKNRDANNHIAVHHQLTNHNIDWDSAQCLTYSTNYFQRLTLESWYTNLEQTPLDKC